MLSFPEFNAFATKLQAKLFLQRSVKPIASVLLCQAVLQRVVLNPVAPWPIRLAGIAGIAAVIYFNRRDIQLESKSFSRLVPELKKIQVVVPILMAYGIAPEGLGPVDYVGGALCFYLASRIFVDPINNAIIKNRAITEATSEASTNAPLPLA